MTDNDNGDTMAMNWILIGYWTQWIQPTNIVWHGSQCEIVGNPSPTVLLSTYLTWQHIGGIPPIFRQTQMIQSSVMPRAFNQCFAHVPGSEAEHKIDQNSTHILWYPLNSGNQTWLVWNPRTKHGGLNLAGKIIEVNGGIVEAMLGWTVGFSGWPRFKTPKSDA